MDYDFKGYRITQVYRNIGPELKEEILRLWLDHRVLSAEEANRRVSEVFLVIRDAADELIGVTTVYTGNFLGQDNPYYFLRMFIQPTARGVFDLASFASKTTKEALKDCPATGMQPRGVVIVTENPKLWGKGPHKVLERDGWIYLGKGPMGNELWYENFDGSRIRLSP